MYWFVFISSTKMWLWCKRAGYLLQHGEWQFVGGTLDLVLGLQVRHPLGADPVDGWDDVALGQAASHRLAARSYLWRGSTGKVTLGAPTRKFLWTHTHTHTDSKNICGYTNICFIDLADIYECWVHSGRKKRNWISLFTWQFNFFSSHATRLLMLHVCVCSSSVN